jgi:hypothetical protein
VNVVPFRPKQSENLVPVCKPERETPYSTSSNISARFNMFWLLRPNPAGILISSILVSLILKWRYKLQNIKKENDKLPNLLCSFSSSSPFLLFLLFLFCLPAVTFSLPFLRFFPFLFGLSAAPLHMLSYLALKFSSLNYSFYFFWYLWRVF